MKQIRHLFLEGPVQTGKSTLIQTLLANHLPCHRCRPEVIAGFTSQRLTLRGADPLKRAESTAFADTEDPTVAYRIVPAMSPLTEPFDEKMLDGKPAENGIFRYIDADGNSHKYPDVFDALAARLTATCLSGLKKLPRIILLDEIGGAELLNDSFREVLHEIIAGDIPCIGVIKREESAAHMISTASYDNSVLDLNRRLRELIIKNDGSILRFERGDETVINSVSEFIGKI